MRSRTGKWTEANRIQTPTEKLEEPPAFVVEHLRKAKRWDGFDHGTVVVWDRLDSNRVDYKRREELRNKLLTDLGVIYRNYLLADSADGRRGRGRAVRPAVPDGGLSLLRRR